MLRRKKLNLGLRAERRKLREGSGGYQLRLRPARCNALFNVENNDIGIKKGPL